MAPRQPKATRRWTSSSDDVVVGSDAADLEAPPLATEAGADALAPGTTDADTDAIARPDSGGALADRPLGAPDDGPADAKTGSTCSQPGCPDSTGPEYLCAVGGCNAAGGICTASGESCRCSADSQCISGKCVMAAGQNDMSCTGCTGAGPADGFGCLLASPGIPAATHSTFGYAPSNFNPAEYAPPSSATTIDCNTTYDTSAHAFTGWCAGQTLPSITPNVAQLASGGPPVDVLAFAGLTIAEGFTLKVTSVAGGNAVIFAVYGSATIAGAIGADGEDGASSSTTPGAPGPGGDFGCGASVGASQPQDGHCSGGGGGGASFPGGAGAGGVGGNPASAGTARAAPSYAPLLGGCHGGTSGSWACQTSGGGGGGAIQISISGLLVFTGSMSASGGKGGTSMCFMSGCGLYGYGGGGGGAGSGGTVLIESQSYEDMGATVYVNGGTGGAPNTAGGGGTAAGGMGGAGGSLLSTAGAAGTGSSAFVCGPYNQCGGGGGGGYGHFSVRPVDSTPCATTLTPAPVLNGTKTSCLCVDDSNCSSGKCVPAGQCTGSCTGIGAADVANCQLIASTCSGAGCE